jgi:curved DNA-binding protein CbpA
MNRAPIFYYVGMPRRTHYQVLGVSREASSIEIANAAREKLAELKSKPNVSEETAEAVREACQVLTNPDLRYDYDASLPVDHRAQKEAQKEAERGPSAFDTVKEIIKEAGVPKVGVAIVVLLMIFIIWAKTRAPYKPPVIVETTRPIVVQPQRKDEPEQPARSAAPVANDDMSATSAAPARPKGDMGAEDVFAAVANSVARIQTFDASGRMIAQGSGVATGNSVVITNCHVVNNAIRISVKVGGNVLEGIVQIADKELDLCSLRVTGLYSTPVVVSTGEVRVGQHVYAIGAPQGLELTLSEGIVSSLRPTSKGQIIQTTAPISPGSSGGGLFDSKGQLIGIVTFQHKTGQNLNFALPATWIFEMQNRESSEDVSTPVGRAATSPQ